MNTIDLIARIDKIARNPKRPKIYRERADPFLVSDEQFKQIYRFNKCTVRKIINLVQPEIELDKRGCGTSVKLQVLVALRCWGQRENQDDAAALHGLAQSTVSRICTRVARALVRLAGNKISMPQSVIEEQTLMKNFESIKSFPGVIGAIGNTYIQIQKKGLDNLIPHKNNRAEDYSINVQVVCDSSFIIRDIIARLTSSTHRSHLFKESTIRERFENGEFKGRLLGNSQYKLENYLFTPLSKPQSKKEFKYNTALADTIAVVEHCLMIWKKRFRCLLDILRNNMKNSEMLIIALAVLHNIAVQENDLVPDDYEIEDAQNEEGDEENDIEHPQDETSATLSLETFIQEHF